MVIRPNTHCYFDYYQSRDAAAEPPAIGGFLPLEQVYDFDLVPRAIGSARAYHVLRVQGNIWTEYITYLGAGRIHGVPPRPGAGGSRLDPGAAPLGRPLPGTACNGTAPCSTSSASATGLP